MDQMQKWITWYRNRPKWQQTAIVSACVMVLAAAGWLMLYSGSENVNNPQTGITAGWAVGVFLKLGAVLLLIVVLAVLLRRYQGIKLTGKQRQMMVLETLSLSPRRALHLVKVGEQVFFIGATDQAITLLSETELSPDAAQTGNIGNLSPAEDQGRSFSDVFSEQQGQGLPDQRR
jgi:flagellar biosynthetic protein FliO